MFAAQPLVESVDVLEDIQRRLHLSREHIAPC